MDTGDRSSLAFPFAMAAGQVRTSGGDEALRERIVQVLFTAPGERVDLPEFGCGLLQLVFEPNDDLLRAAAGFTVAQGLTRWLGDEIAVDGVDVSQHGEHVVVEVAYTRRADLRQEGLRVQFQGGPVWKSD
ncbi:GPW/gp25 family protein [Thermomonospora amylolytica]|uniref:GPW/gp25 family protein n=1 Tax=Thermomonospora amylolytica TaxID=1411117 RepID=UPI0018E4EE0A|nr:GPW/gp25 family protein [Thermomonospora amylolytica]